MSNDVVHDNPFRAGQRNAKGRIICGAKNRQGKPCGKSQIFENGRCRNHGGMSLGGMAHPNYKTGKRSKFLPTRMHARYAEALADDELLTLRDDVALLETRLADVLGRVDTGESGNAWRKAQDALREFENTQDPAEALRHIDALKRAVGEGVADYGAWGEVKELLEQRRRVVGDERKHVLETGRIVTIEQLMLWVGALAADLRRVMIDTIDDESLRRKVLSGVQTAFTKLVGDRDQSRPALSESGSAIGAGRESVGVSGEAT